MENPLSRIYIALLKKRSHQTTQNQKPAADRDKRENWQPGFHLHFLLTSLAKKKRSMCLFILSAVLIKKTIQHENEWQKRPPQKVVLISHGETA